ncbi:unnamed protein product [Parajaminaea phylloscopi]
MSLLAQQGRQVARAVASRTALRSSPQLQARTLTASPFRWQPSKQPERLKPGQVDEHARVFDPDSRRGTAAAAASEGGDVSRARPVDVQSDGKETMPQVDEHARIFDPDSRAGTAAAAVSEGGDISQSRPTDIETGSRGQAASASTSSAPPAPDADAGSSVDPGYEPPSPLSDPFPLPYDSSINLASPSQSDALKDYGAPLRVPGREPGTESREQRIRRLIYQTRKRGILETDLLMSTFAMQELWEMPDAEVEEFDHLLDEPDWDIYYWLVQRKPVPERWQESFETPGRLGYRLRRHTKNEKKEMRWMPDEPPLEGAGRT